MVRCGDVWGGAGVRGVVWCGVVVWAVGGWVMWCGVVWRAVSVLCCGGAGWYGALCAV